MIAFDIKTDQAALVVAKALEAGLILNNTGPRTVRMVPPLIIGKPEADEALATIDKVLTGIT